MSNLLEQDAITQRRHSTVGKRGNHQNDTVSELGKTCARGESVYLVQEKIPLRDTTNVTVRDGKVKMYTPQRGHRNIPSLVHFCSFVFRPG